MKVNNWLVVLLVFIGVGIGGVSLYMASLSGVMGKMGLVGGDFSQAIDSNKLARQLIAQDESLNCGLWSASRQIPKYLISKDGERVRISGEMGGQRIVCGVREVQGGNVERGVYTIMKGLYYLKTHYTEMRILVEREANNCQLLKDPTYERWVEAYLFSTEGRIHEVVLGVYRQVENSRAKVEELCSD